MKLEKDIQNKLIDIIKKINSNQFNVSKKSLNQDLLISGILDSFGFVEYILTIEEQFNITFSEKEQFQKKIRSVNGMEVFIKAKLIKNENKM